MIATLVVLFFVHGRQREDEREKRLQYWREQVKDIILDVRVHRLTTHRRMPSARISCKCTRQLATPYFLLKVIALLTVLRRRTPMHQCYSMLRPYQRALGCAIMSARKTHTRLRAAITSNWSCGRLTHTTGFECRSWGYSHLTTDGQ